MSTCMYQIDKANYLNTLEHRANNAKVAGSIPTLAIIYDMEYLVLKIKWYLLIQKPRRKHSLDMFYLFFQIKQLKKLNFKERKLKEKVIYVAMENTMA